MPINSKIKSLYDALKADGADVGSEQEFSDWFQAPGEQGYNNRKYVYDTFKADGADVGKNYEEFAGWLGLHAVQPQVAQVGTMRQPTGQTAREPQSPQQEVQQPAQVAPREVVASQATQGGFGGGQMGGGGANTSWSEVTNATPTPTPVIEPQQPTDVKQKIQPAELTEKEVGDNLAFMREVNRSQGDIPEDAPQDQDSRSYWMPHYDKNWKAGYSQSWGKINELFDGLDYGKKDATSSLDAAVNSRYDGMSDQAIESELQKLSKEYKAGEWDGVEDSLIAHINRLQMNLIAHEYGFKNYKDMMSRRGEAEYEMYKYHPAFDQEWLATYDGGPGENPLVNMGKEIVKKQLIEDTMNGVPRPDGYYQSLPFRDKEFSKRYASWALKRAKALGNMGFADVYNNGIKAWESYIGSGLLESGAEEAMAQGAGYGDVGIAGGKYNADFDAAAATAWGMAEDEYRRLTGTHNNEIWGDYASMGGGREARMVASGEWAVSNMADRLSSHDLDKMIDNAWKSLGESKQKQIVLAAAQNLKQQYPGMSPAEMVKTAQSMVRQQTIQRVLDYAKEQNAPKNVVDYFARKVLEQNSIFKIQEAMARNRAGTTGDWQARDMAMQEYGKNHRIAGVAGTVVGMGLDPVTYISAGVGKGAAAGTVKLIEKLGGAAGRKWLTTTAGKVVVGAAGGAANLGTFEGLNETLNQLRWGGSPAVDLKTGLIKTTGYDVGKIGKAIFHGSTMGAGTGIVAPLMGNVWSPIMEATSSTAGKMAVKTGELFTGTIAEGTIFSIPDVYDAYTESEDIIKSFSDKKSRNYISDDQERAKAIAKVREKRNETMLDIWNESVATMAGFKAKHIAERLYEVSKSGNGRVGFETRLRYMLDRKPDLALTKDEQAELERGGYTDLKGLVDEYVKAEKSRRANSKPVVTGRPRTMELGTREEDMPYNRFVDLMNDGSISEAARAKMYYYITGHALPMSTVMYGQLTENKDRDGNVKGYTVQSIGANGVVTSREFTSRKRAENELQKVNRQIELNTIDIGERYNESVGNSTKELREEIGQKYDVDVEKALKKEPKRRSAGEQMALDEYMRMLFPEKEAREEDAEDVTFSEDTSVTDETTNGFTDEATDESDAIVVETLNRTGEDGMVHPAVLKGEDEAGVNIVSGNVVTLADGTIDVANSDPDIVVVDANGERKMVSINDIASVGDVVDPNAVVDAAVQANAPVTGIEVGGRYNVVDEQNTQHEVEVLRDNGNGTVEVRVDGAEDSVPMVKSQLEQMLGVEAATMQQPSEQTPASPEATNDMVEADIPEAGNERYSVDPNADGRAMGMAGFSEQDIAATVDYLNGKLGDREYLETVGISADTLDATSDEQIASWVNSIVERASEFITDATDEAAAVQPPTEQSPDVSNDGNIDTTVTPPTTEPSATTALATEEVADEVEAMPMGDDGEADFASSTPEQGHRYIYEESGLPKAMADATVENGINDAEAAIKKHAKKEPGAPKPGKVQEWRSKHAQWEAEGEHLRQEKEYWKKVKAIEQDRQAQAAAERKAKDAEVAAQAQAEEAQRQAEELAKQQEQAQRGAGAVHPAIAEKWGNAPKVEGYDNEITLANGDKIQGRYVLTESGAATPSHNALREFEKSEGFPVDENGNTVNDRDYERDKDAQNITRKMGDTYDSRAIQQVPVVSRDGVVLSGNGRTMAGELAASNNTDKAYIDHLKKYGKQFGFSPEQVSSMKHPRVVFVPDADMPYTTDTFAKFNEQEMKGQSKTEQAVKLGKVVDDATFNQIVRAINDYETLPKFYANKEDATVAINALRRAGALNEMQYAEMFDGDAVSDRGRQMIENMLIGKAFEGNPDAIRQLTEFKGLRQSVVTALGEISTNLALGKEYSLEKELAQAIDLTYHARHDGYKEGQPVSPYATTMNLFPFDFGETEGDYNNATVLLLADKLNHTNTTALKKWIHDYNQRSAQSAAGAMDLFSGGIESKQDIIKGVLDLLHNGETEETERPAESGTSADERGGEASLQENGAGSSIDESDARKDVALTTPQTEQSIDAAIVEAGKETNTEPTDAQKEAGNYKKGHVKIDGFDVSIEQPKGSVRSGVDATGKAWSQKMNNTYGYIRGTEGVDGDHIDVFFSDNLDDWNGTVYVIDQVEKGGIFDEHKVMYGFNSEEEARKAYLSNYEDGWDGLGAITAVSKDEFKKWIDSSHRKTKPFAEYKNVKVGETQEQEPKQQGTLFPATEQQPSSKSETKPRTTEKQPAEAPKERIDDVGEKIEGAKKDLAHKMGERINLDADTFPKMFPKYDLKKLISQGLDPNLAVMTKMLRQMAQADYKHYSKKRMYGKSYALRAARFYAAYAKQVLEAGDSNVDFKSEGLGFTDYGKQFVELNKRLFEELYKKLGDDLFDLDLAGVKIQPLSQKEGSTWFRRNQETGEMEPYNPAYAFVGPRGQNYYEANELDKALQEGVEQVAKSIDYKKTHPYKLGHYYKPGIKNSDYVGVKLGGKVVPLTEPMTSSEVRKYMSEHNAELQAKAAQLDEQRKLDKKKGGTGEGRWKPELTLGGGRPRVGVDRRGGVDVEPEEFRKAFSFRGVQFGNYVTQRERQRFLNEAYDALMDMAELLGISPRAIAIDGRLGFAIGARGGGKANAHYEPIENVINLTKSKGAGSLAHEWFHALDYYFNRSNKKPTSSTANKSAEQFPSSTRNEMRKAFLDLMSAIKNSDYFKRSENLEMKLRSGKLDEGYYDKPTELAARAFQDYVVRKLADQGKINDFLSSFTSEEEWNGEPENYPFPIGAEAEKIDEKFDALFDAMQERTDEEGNTILYHLGKEHDVLTDTEIALRDGLVDVMRSVGIDVETDEVKGQKALDSARRANATLQEMRAWHGSGADFDAFDHIHMGEGEGAQAYGWGTYVTQVEGIARSYASDGNKYIYKGRKVYGNPYSQNVAEQAAFYIEQEQGINNAIKFIRGLARDLKGMPEGENFKDILSVLQDKDNWSESKHYLYEVEIPDNNGENYISWNETLPKKHRRRIAAVVRDLSDDLLQRNTHGPNWLRGGFEQLANTIEREQYAGKEITEKLRDALGSSRAVSEIFSKAGFVGTEYPAQYLSGGRKDGAKNYVIFNEKDIKIDNRTQYFISADGVVYGFVKDGKIYIDPKIATAETPIHEYCHLWGDALKEANPEGWERLKETMLDEKDVLDYVKKMYPGLEGDALVSEVFSHYSGRRGAERLRADMEREVKNAEGVFAKARVARVFDIIRRALSRFWEMARDLFAGKNSMLNGMRAEDFADMAMADMLRGFDPRGVEKDRGEGVVGYGSTVLGQGFGSAATSLNQVPSATKKINWEPGTVNVDIGGGRFDKATDYLRERGVENLVFDPFNRNAEHNKAVAERVRDEKVDTVTCNNVLNVIDSEASRANVILQAAKALKKGGTAYFSVYEGDKSGVGRQTKSDSWQNNRPTKDYVKEVEQYFDDVTLKNSVITARNPKPTDELSVWDFDGEYNGNGIAFERGSSYRSGSGDVIRFESHAEQLSLFGGGQADAVRQPTEQTAQRQRRASEMSDAELLSEMGRDIAELEKAGRADWGVQTLYSEEYDRRHIKEYNEECDRVRTMLDENNVDVEQAEQMLLDTIFTWREGYATADRSRLLAQFDTLNDYYAEKEDERDNADLVESDTAAMQQPTEQTADETGAERQHGGPGSAVEQSPTVPVIAATAPTAKRAGVFNPAEIKLRKLKSGETCYVERRYQESGGFDFTGSEKVESDADLAYIFRNLENSAIENTFLVLIKNGKATILHVGMGGYAFSPGHLGAGVLATSQLKPDHVIFVHNHPSGTLKPSQQDVAMQTRVKKMFGEGVVREAIIIDITSGKYSIFDSDGSDIEKQRPTSAKNEVPYKTYSFGQQVFAKDYVPDSAFQITDSGKAAEFISGHRLGERDKLSLIVLNRQKRVTGNIFLPWTSLDGVDVNKAAGVIAKFIHQMGGESGILYGSGTISRSTLSPLARAIDNYEVRLDDFINVEGVSAQVQGVLEEGVEYQPTAGNTGPANKDALESVAETNKIVEDLPQLWGVRKDFGTYHTIDSEETLENLISRTGLSKKDAEELRDAYYDDDVLGCGSPDRDMVILFTEKFKSKKVLANIAAHETFHIAYKYLERDEHNRFNNAILEWFRAQSWGDKFVEALHQSYDTSKWATETMAYFVGHEVEKHGWDKFLSGEIDYGNEEIHNFVSRFKNIITNGNISQISGESRGEALSDVERAGQRGRQPGQRGRQPGQRGSNEQSDDRGWQRASSSLVNEEGVGYGDADDSGISDEELAGYDAGRYSFAESITQGLVDLATKNADDQQLRMNAMREFGGNLAKLRKLMNKQKAYDKATVDDIVRLTRMVMGNGFFKDMRASEVKRLLAAIKKGVGVEDLTPIANNVVDMLVQHQLRESKAMLHKLMQVKGRKVDARGVEVQAGLDIDGQRMMSALKDGMSLGENGLLTRINDCENRLGSEDEVIRKNAMSEYQGLMLAKEYHDNILSGEEEEIVLRNEKRQEQEKIYDFRREPVLDKDGNAIMNLDGSVRTVERKTLKPEFKNNVTDENKQLRRNTEAAIERIEQSIRESRMERVTAYSDFMSDVAGDVRASRERAAAWRAEQQERIDEIHHNANSDLEGVPVQSQTKMPEGGLLAFNSNNDIVRLLFQPLATFEKILRFFGRKSHNGEGYLFNRFMRGWADCSDKEWRSKRAAHEELDAKVRELFGKKAKRWSDLYEIERNKKHPGIPVEYWDNGERVRETMSQGEALSLVVWSKQKDAEAGLRRMGISEEDIETIKSHLDPKFLELANWVVEEFLPKRREYYNEVHERMFGAPMAAIEHYFPIVRNSRDVEKPSDITERDLGDTKPSTITGNIIKRQRTAAALDVHTDFFDHLLKHLDDMENWAAWAEFNRDINTLRNYKRFKNRVLNMHSVEFGSGKDLWKAFDDACAIAAGVYHPSTKRGSGDNLAVNVAKGVTGAKIAFRFYTAAKQLLSLPAFWNGDASLLELAKWENPVGAIIAWNWAMKNLPGFSKRWQSRQVGDVRLMDTDSDYAFWRNNMVRALSRGGMWANALVDGMTVAMGARAVYETRKRRYLRNGYSEEQAEKRAMQDAAINYNSSQQSSENAFLSSLQLDRTWWSTLMTVFRSASMGYQRRLTTGLRNLKNRMKKGYKAESIEFMKKQMVRDGIDEATAEKAARRTYRWGGLKSMADVFVFGLVLPFFWNLGPYALYLLMGDDDDEKKDMLKDAAVHSLFGPVEGLTGGQAMSEIGNTWAGYLMSDNDKSLLNALRYHDYLSMPLGSDLQQIFNEAGTDSMAAWSDAFNLLVQAGIGVNPETFTDAWVAIADACDGDPQTTKEFALCFMRVMQVPQTQVDKLFVDELGMTARDAQKLNAMEMADRYAKYKKFRNAPLLNWAYSADESQKVAEKYRKRFLDNMQERMERLNDEQLEWNFANPNDSERRKATGKAYAKGKGVKDTAGQKPASNWKPETRRSQLKYQRLRDWTDLAEDVLLDTAIEQAKNRGDEEKLKALRDAKKELTEIKRGKHTETWDIDGLGDGSAEDDKAIMEELRARRKELLRELGVI